MKKIIAMLLSVVLLLSAIPIFAFAENGPMGAWESPWGGLFYLAYITFYETDETGEVLWDSENSMYVHHEVFRDDTVYNTPGEQLECGGYQGMEGAVYDRETNTLTITDLAAENMLLETNVMGDDFTLNVVGNCTVGQILVYGDGYGGSLHITGDGTLTVNPNRIFENAIRLHAEQSDSALTFGRDVTVNLYATEDVAAIIMTARDTADTAFTFANGAKPTVTKAQASYEHYKFITGYELEDPDDSSTSWRSSSVIKVVCNEDPDGIYGAIKRFRINDDGTLGDDYYGIMKLNYVEKYDAYFEDTAYGEAYGDSSGEIAMTPEELDASSFSIVYDDDTGEEVRIDNAYTYPSSEMLYMDADGNRYCVISSWSTGEKTQYAVTMEQIGDTTDYIFVRDPSVDVSTLTPDYDVIVYDDLFDYVLTGTQFQYVPKTVEDVGDVSGDGKINAVDARWVLQAASGVRPLTEAQAAVADVNGDGKVNAVDARWILQIASGARVL